MAINHNIALPGVTVDQRLTKLEELVTALEPMGIEPAFPSHILSAITAADKQRQAEHGQSH